MPTVAIADYVQVADGVYRDGSTLYIGSGDPNVHIAQKAINKNFDDC